jgi:hypothetical protein
MLQISQLDKQTQELVASGLEVSAAYVTQPPGGQMKFASHGAMDEIGQYGQVTWFGRRS